MTHKTTKIQINFEKSNEHWLGAQISDLTKN